MSQTTSNSKEISPRIELLVELLDRRFHVPGTNFRFGLDALMGLVPGIGDFLGMLIGSVLLWEAYRHNAPLTLMGRMIFNLWLDGVLGSIPLLGDTFDFFFKAHRRNLKLLQDHVGGTASA